MMYNDKQIFFVMQSVIPKEKIIFVNADWFHIIGLICQKKNLTNSRQERIKNTITHRVFFTIVHYVC